MSVILKKMLFGHDFNVRILCYNICFKRMLVCASSKVSLKYNKDQFEPEWTEKRDAEKETKNLGKR